VLGDQDSVPGQNRDFCHQHNQTSVGGPTDVYALQIRNSYLSLGIKQLEHEADHVGSLIAEVNA
jgi:hypothetical protein